MGALRTGMIGCGHIAKRHADLLVGLEDVDLVAFCDREPQAAEAFRQRYGRGEVYSDCEEMFEDVGMDLVYICLPPFAHGNEVELACHHGVHFFIEKPIALTMDLARAMAEQVRVSGVKSQVGCMYRFGEAAQWLKRRMLESSAACAFMTGRYACNSLHGWWWRDRSKSGGQLVEQAIHLLDLSRFFLGEPVEVYSMQDNLFHRDVEGYTIEDVSASVIRFDSGGIAVITATNGAIPNRWDCDWRIVLPNLTADFTDANHAVFHHTDQNPPTTDTIAVDKDMYLAQTLDLLAGIREDRMTAVPIQEGVRSLHLALSAVRSAELGAPIKLERSL